MKLSKRILSIALVLALALSGGVMALASDTPSSWAQAEVNRAIALGLVPSNLQGSYTNSATRAEFCALVVPVYEKIKGEITERVTFSDTTDVNVEKAAAIGVVNGTGEGNNFAPNDQLNREQAATMLARLASAAGKSLKNANPTFSDNASISSWATGSVGSCQADSVMSGIGDGRFDPSGPYTREQSMLTSLRLYDYVVNPGSSISYYPEFPEVPDFGAMSGVKPNYREDLDGAVGYFYSVYGITAEQLDTYEETLYTEGFIYLDSFTNDDGYEAFIFMKGDVVVCITRVEPGLVLILITDTDYLESLSVSGGVMGTVSQLMTELD